MLLPGGNKAQAQPQQWQMQRLRSHMAWVQILTLPFISCVTSAKLLNLSVPSFLICKLG